MPAYDYYCKANGRTVEVRHKMSERITSWGELCERAGLPLGDTPASAPVEKLITGGNMISASSLGSGAAPMCEAGPACCGGGCAALD